MSWSADIVIQHDPTYATVIEVVDGHTYNLSPMWRLAGVFDKSSDLDGVRTIDLAPKLVRALVLAWENADDFRAINPPNGWGDYDGFLETLTKFTRLTLEHPRGVVRWSG